MFILGDIFFKVEFPFNTNKPNLLLTLAYILLHMDMIIPIENENNFIGTSTIFGSY